MSTRTAADPRSGRTHAPAAVVVCTRDRPAQLEACLPTVLQALRDGDELVVVDSASHDPAVGRIAAASATVVVRCEQPGLSRARNAGLRASTAPLVAFTDDDCRAASGWVAAM